MLQKSQKNMRYALVRARLGLTLAGMDEIIRATSWKRWEYGGMVPRRSSLDPLLVGLEAAGVPDPPAVLDGLAGELSERQFARALGLVVVLDGAEPGPQLLEQLERCSGLRAAVLAGVCRQAIGQGQGALTWREWREVMPTP